MFVKYCIIKDVKQKMEEVKLKLNTEELNKALHEYNKVGKNLGIRER